MKIASGSYAGNGTAQDVTGLGAAADLVLIKGGTNIMQFWCSAMPAASRKPLTGSTAPTTTNSITQHASGFSVGSDTAVNANGTTYYWLAINDNGVADFQVGSYAGTGVDGRSLTPLDFDPNVVIVASGGADAACLRLSSHNGDASQTFTGAVATNLIQSFVTNGWTVGNSSTTNNVDGRTYYYAAWKDIAGIAKVINDGSNRAYQGDGTTDNRTITGAGFQPDAFAFVKSASAVVATSRYKAHTGDQSADFDATSATLTDRIQAFMSDGYQIGLATRVGSAATDYHSFVLKEGTSAGGGGGASTTARVRQLLMGVG